MAAGWGHRGWQSAIGTPAQVLQLSARGLLRSHRLGMLRLMRGFVLRTLRRWPGRLLVGVLVWGLVIGPVPLVQVHAHADAPVGHHSLTELGGGAMNLGAEGEEPSTTFHAHVTSGAYLALVAPAELPVVSPQQALLFLPLAGPAVASRHIVPPHRPPIG